MANVQSPMQTLFPRGNPLISKKVTHKDAVKAMVLQIKFDHILHGGETWWIVYLLPMIYDKEREGIGEERGFHLSSQDHILVAMTTSKDFHMPKDPYSILDAESHTRRTLSKIWFAISEFEISWV